MYHINKIENGIEKRHLSCVADTYENAYAALEAMADNALKSALTKEAKYPVLHKWALTIGEAIYRIEHQGIEGARCG